MAHYISGCVFYWLMLIFARCSLFWHLGEVVIHNPASPESSCKWLGIKYSLFEQLTRKTVFELYLIHLQGISVADFSCFIFIYASFREIQLHPFHQQLTSCSAAYWFLDSSFLSEGIVLRFSFSFLICKNKN